MSSVTDQTTFANLKVLHGENGVLVDRTSSHDFSTKMVCATVPSLSPFVIARLTSPRDDKQSVFSELTSLRAAMTDKDDAHKLDDAIKSLSDSLAPALWIDALHLQAKTGDQDFDEEKQTVIKLIDLAIHKHSSVSGDELLALSDRIASADRQLAQIAINDAIAAHGDTNEIDQANKQLAKGDQDTASSKPQGIDDYREAWKHAVKSARKE